MSGIRGYNPNPAWSTWVEESAGDNKPANIYEMVQPTLLGQALKLPATRAEFDALCEAVKSPREHPVEEQTRQIEERKLGAIQNVLREAESMYMRIALKKSGLFTEYDAEKPAWDLARPPALVWAYGDFWHHANMQEFHTRGFDGCNDKFHSFIENDPAFKVASLDFYRAAASSVNASRGAAGARQA